MESYFPTKTANLRIPADWEVQTNWNHPTITSRAPQAHKVLTLQSQQAVRKWMRRMWFPDNPSMGCFFFFFYWGLTQLLCMLTANHHISHRELSTTTHPALPWWSHWLVRALAVSVNTHLKWQCHKCGGVRMTSSSCLTFFFVFFFKWLTVCKFIPPEEWQWFRHNLSEQNWTLNFTLAWCSGAPKSQP